MDFCCLAVFTHLFDRYSVETDPGAQQSFLKLQHDLTSKAGAATVIIFNATKVKARDFKQAEKFQDGGDIQECDRSRSSGHSSSYSFTPRVSAKMKC